MSNQRGTRQARRLSQGRPVAGDEYVTRHPYGVVVLSGDEVILMSPERVPMAMRARDPWAFATVLRATLQPTRARVLSTPPLQDALSALIETGLLVRAASVEAAEGVLGEISTFRPASPTPARPICRHMVICATGAIQAMNLPRLLFSALVSLAENIDIVLTETAQRFVTTGALTALGARVWTDSAPTSTIPVPHVHLSRADVVVMTPATAAALHRIAAGSCSDLSSLVVAMTRAPVMLVAAMNENMWTSPAIVRNARQVVADGHYLVLPGGGTEVSNLYQPASSYGGVGVPEHRYGVVIAAILEHARSRRHPTLGPLDLE